MQQFTRKPVKVFRWDDTGAPQVGHQTAGDLKTVLKACLKTGYGSKTSLGWDIVAEDTNRIAVRSANAASTKNVLFFADVNGNSAEVQAYESMTNLETGIGKFRYTYDSTVKYMPKSSYSGKMGRWVIVGHDTAFWLILNPGADTYMSTYLFFGDFPSFRAGDQFNCARVGWLESSANAIGLYTNGTGLRSVPNSYYALSRAADQTNKNLTGAHIAAALNNVAGVYPDAISGGWVGAPAYLCEDNALRGILPGVLASSNFTQKNAFPFATELPQSSDTTDKHIWLNIPRSSTAYSMILNTTAWLSP